MSNAHVPTLFQTIFAAHRMDVPSVDAEAEQAKSEAFMARIAKMQACLLNREHITDLLGKK